MMWDDSKVEIQQVSSSPQKRTQLDCVWLTNSKLCHHFQIYHVMFITENLLLCLEWIPSHQKC